MLSFLDIIVLQEEQFEIDVGTWHRQAVTKSLAFANGLYSVVYWAIVYRMVEIDFLQLNNDNLKNLIKRGFAFDKNPELIKIYFL